MAYNRAFKAMNVGGHAIAMSKRTARIPPRPKSIRLGRRVHHRGHHEEHRPLQQEDELVGEAPGRRLRHRLRADRTSFASDKPVRLLRRDFRTDPGPHQKFCRPSSVTFPAFCCRSHEGAAMGDTNSSWRPMQRVTGLLAVLLACSVACNSGPTRPSDAEVAGRYTGKWLGNINGFEVVLDIQAGVGDLVGITGTGTARNPATREIHRLELIGFGTINYAHGTDEFRLLLPAEVPAAPLRDTGEFRGNVSPDGRTWPGRWTATNTSDGVPIFGLGVYSVTLIKE